MPERLTHHHYEQLARDRQFDWLGEEVPKNVRKKTIWRCGEGHCWEASYGSIKYAGSGCPHCAGLARKQMEDYQALAAQFGLFWLGPVVKNTQAKTKWLCSKKHSWQATYNTISQGYGCPYCAQKAAKTPDDYRALAKDRGFVWLGPVVPTVREKTQWRCAQNHIWHAAYSWIKSGTGCPACARLSQKTESDYEALAQRRGFTWLGPLVKNVTIKTQWRCENGHIWRAPYSSIGQGTGCPACAAAEASKTESDYYDLAHQRSIEWLGPTVKNTKTKTQWRCAKNHTWFTTYSAVQQGAGCPTCADIKRKKEVDYHRLADKRGIKWLGPPVKNVNTKTQWRCHKNHSWFATYNGVRLRGKCPTCAGFNNQRKTEADYQALAEQREFEWLGPPVKNTKTKTQWRCANNHSWFTTYSSIQRGSGCKQCKHNSPETLGKENGHSKLKNGR